MALRDENQPWRFETRTPAEMDQENPVHAAEHLEFAEKAMAAIQALMELAENAPCPGTAKTLLEQVNQMSAVGLITVFQKEMEWAERHRVELEAGQQGSPRALPQPQQNIPDAFKGIFKQFPGLAEGA